MKIRIFDNGGKTFDRYTVIYPKQNHPCGPYYPFIGMSDHPTHPQGFGQHGELQPPGKYGFKGLGKKIAFDDLPPDCQKLVSLELREYEALDRLEYLRTELRNETISYVELAELQSLAQYIDPSDLELLEAAGVAE